MTNETIAAVIDWMNQGNRGDRLFTRSIDGGVHHGIVWLRGPDDPCSSGYVVYLVRNDAGLYVAAVIDMGEQDLHGYTTPDYRRKGVMAAAMRNVILPHLASRGRSQQWVSFQTSDGRNLVSRLGFEITKEISLEGPGEAHVSLRPTRAFPDSMAVPLTPKRLAGVRARIKEARNLCKIIADEVRTSLGQHCRAAEHLEEAEYSLSWVDLHVDDENCELTRSATASGA